jgi:molybdenum cofactor cytidylyltransferase
MTLAAAVLAAGPSRRMGSPKALLDFHGQPFVVSMLEALEALEARPRVVVLGPDAARIRPALVGHDCLIVENPHVAGGEIGSLRAALAAVRTVRPTAILAWPVDLPHVRLATLERLPEAYRRSGARAVLPTFAERRGQPVIWDQALFDELETSAAATRDGAEAVLDRHQAHIVSVAVDDPAVIDDLNTPEDYERLVREVNRDIY